MVDVIFRVLGLIGGWFSGGAIAGGGSGQLGNRPLEFCGKHLNQR
jgi:hypothetical protein